MNIVLIAHDSKKKLMQNLCIAYKGILIKHTLYATETTGRLVENASGLTVHKFLTGHLGGIQQIATQIETNQIDMVIFLHDPMILRSQDNAYYNVFTICDIHNIPIATNLASAELMIKSIERGDLDWRNLYKH
ncbi:MAG: methylglyoxal synthase [Eubacterium sp.]|nr:methylglyoxal synthase [Eubacterium sp.]MCR5293248.1 methylglyoxal synthase [Eubacterium sp.]